jgi:hypothetical protein
MNKVCWVLAIVLLPIAAVSSAADEPAAPKAGEDGWISLFDGHSLKGWKASEHPEQWKVDDGRIVAAGPRSHLFYMGDDESNPPEFKNFEFRAEVMTTRGSNSGIYFHSRFQPVGFPDTGFEAQVNNTNLDPVKTGSLYHIVKNFKAPAKDNVWFTEEVVVKGDTIVIKVNGKVICEYTEPADKKATPEEIEKGVMEKISKGTFALQAHDPRSTTYYRNIMVKPLP